MCDFLTPTTRLRRSRVLQMIEEDTTHPADLTLVLAWLHQGISVAVTLDSPQEVVVIVTATITKDHLDPASDPLARDSILTTQVYYHRVVVTEAFEAEVGAECQIRCSEVAHQTMT